MVKLVARDLKHHLDAFLNGFPRDRHVSNDPVQFVHHYDDPRDREVAGIMVVSAFAYGNVKSILLRRTRPLVSRERGPAQALAAFDPRRDARRLRASITDSTPAATSASSSG